jgi:hypothetical protein
MRFLRRHWYNIGLVWVVAAVAWAVVGRLSTVQLILLLNFVALVLHQFEEYGWPGGLPWIFNQVVRPLGGPPDRYPLNQNNAAFINILAWPFCLAPALFPEQRWLGLAMVAFTFGQLVFHGVVSNRELKSLYNPGLAAVVLLHVPLAAWYLVEEFAKGGFTPRDCLLAVVYLAFFIGLVMNFIGYKLLVSRNSPYPFALEEMERYDPGGKLARLGIGGAAKPMSE